MPDFIAKLHFKPIGKEPAYVFVGSKFRDALKFDIDKMATGCFVTLSDDYVLSGDVVDAELSIIATPYFKGRLFVGAKFRLIERKPVEGEIVRIINKDLILKATENDL